MSMGKIVSLFIWLFGLLNILQVLELGGSVVFGAVVIGGAVAAALAFGLGGREWAGRKLKQLDAKAASADASHES